MITIAIIIALIIGACIGYICGYGIGEASGQLRYIRKRIDTLDRLHCLLSDGTLSKEFFEGALWTIKNADPKLDEKEQSYDQD